MPQTLATQDLLAELKSKAAAAGLKLTAEGPDNVAGEMETIRSKWWLGGRKAVYRMSCRLEPASHAVKLREAVVETSWGLPPPTLSVETESVSGWKRSGSHSEVSVGGGGTTEFARVRAALEEVTSGAGWHLEIEGGRMP